MNIDAYKDEHEEHKTHKQKHKHKKSMNSLITWCKLNEFIIFFPKLHIETQNA